MEETASVEGEWRPQSRLFINGECRIVLYYRDGLGDLELCWRLAGLLNPAHDRRCFNCTQAGSIGVSWPFPVTDAAASRSGCASLSKGLSGHFDSASAR